VATGPRRAAAAGVSDPVRLTTRSIAAAALMAVLATGTRADAQDPEPSAVLTKTSDAEILGRRSEGLRLESVMTRIASFDQFGHGFQSQAGPPRGPGSERTTVLEPQLEVIVLQGDRLRHVLHAPIDVISAASPDAIDNGPTSVDVMSSASRRNIAGTIDWSATYRADRESNVSMRGGIHLEETLRSWHGGLGLTQAFADGDTVVAASALEVFDWFDRFDIGGHRHGRKNRSSTTASIGITQIVTPTTVVNANYGLTVQEGVLGNTWNSVPLTTGDRGDELFPPERVRHALVGRASQFLPWNGALRLYYRFYADDWGLIAHSVEGQLLQRLSPFLYVGALYRFHAQTGVGFFTTLASPDMPLRTADSDLAPLDSHTIGGKIVLDVPIEARIRVLHLEVGYERYFRTNDLHMDIFTCATGYRF
jgi:hypothetical protein